MQRVTKFIATNAPTVQSLHVEQGFVPNGIYTQCVRWKRKPIWLPPAKSKLFKVPQRPETDPAEMAEIQRLFNNYRTYFRSIRMYFIEITKNRELQMDEFHQNQKENEDFKRCTEINNLWNAEQAVQREKRMVEEREERLQKVAMKVYEKEQRDKMRQAEADAKIRQLKEEFSHFITPENIDTAIAEALENVVDPNYAIDINGQVVTDFNTAEKYRNPRFSKFTLRYIDNVQQKGKGASTAAQ